MHLSESAKLGFNWLMGLLLAMIMIVEQEKTTRNFTSVTCQDVIKCMAKLLISELT